MSMLQNDHDHSHGHSHGSEGVSPFQGSPKTMFFFGLFAGIAASSTLALILLVTFVMSGKNLGAAGAQIANAQVPSQQQPVADPSQQQPSTAGPVKPVDEKNDHIIGAKNAKVTLIEYSDFECPFCKRHFPTIEQLLKDYPNDVRVVFRHYPLSFHQNAQKEAEASECAAELGGNDAFWKFHDKVFTETQAGGTGLALERLPGIAKEIGLDEGKFKTCLDSGKYVAKIQQQQQEGSDAGVEGTPATFVNGQLVSGAVPVSQFKSIIDRLKQ